MRYLLDSNVCILLLGQQLPTLQQRVRHCEEGELAISAVTFAEIALGSLNGKLPALPVLDAFVRDVPILPFDEAAARKYAQLSFRRRSFDRLIAAHALSLGLVIVTDNEHDFADIPDLRIENWTK